jgi:hypothetical protein
MPGFSSIFLKFSSNSFKVSGPTFRSLIYFGLTFVQSERYGSSFSLLHEYPLFPKPFVEEADFSSLYVFGAFLKKQMAIAM